MWLLALDLHGGTVLVWLLLPGPDLLWRLGVAGAVAVSLGYQWALYRGYWPQRQVRRVLWGEFGGWELETAAGEHLPVIMSDSSFSSLPLTVLNLRTRPALGRRRFTLIVTPDNCPFVLRQQLRRRLKLRALSALTPRS
ncbi:MAG: hypothetical protein R3E95_15910 [Thiolinea sp.]